MCEWGTFYHGDGKRWRDPSLAAALGGKQVLNGDALLIYPGDFLGLDGPVPCIRLKALRRASQDYEYIWLLSQRTGDARAADEIVDSVLLRAMHEALKPGQDYWKPRRAGQPLPRPGAMGPGQPQTGGADHGCGRALKAGILLQPYRHPCDKHLLALGVGHREVLAGAAMTWLTLS